MGSSPGGCQEEAPASSPGGCQEPYPSCCPGDCQEPCSGSSPGGCQEPYPPCCPGERGETGPMGPRGEPGPCVPAGPPGYPQNSAFASFLGRELYLPENSSLPLRIEIPDITKNISLCNDFSVLLTPGYYAVYYYISAAIKRHGFIKLTPIFNDCEQLAYSACAEAAKRTEMLTISRYFIAEIPSESMLFFAWDSSAGASKINMNLTIEKLGRQ